MRRTRQILALVVVALAAAALVVAACAPASTGGNKITLQNIAFNPASLTVKAGDTVTFNNADSVSHHIVVGTDDLGVQQPAETKTWKAPKDGVYIMKCLIHPTMQGKITVGAGGSTVGTAPAGGGTGGTGGTGY
jgi:plastocyanin